MTILDTARAEALFASTLQLADAPTAGKVRAAVTERVLAIGVRGCAACVAAEFGDHPEAAVIRMQWALAVVAVTYRRNRTAQLVAR